MFIYTKTRPAIAKIMFPILWMDKNHQLTMGMQVLNMMHWRCYLHAAWYVACLPQNRRFTQIKIIVENEMIGYNPEVNIGKLHNCCRLFINYPIWWSNLICLMLQPPLSTCQAPGFIPGASASLQAFAPICPAEDMIQGQPWTVCLINCFNMFT